MRLRRKEADKGRKRAALPAWASSQPKTNRKGFNRTWPPGQRALEKRTIQKATTIIDYQTYWFLRHNGLIMYSTSSMVDGRHHDWECRSSGRKWVWGLRLLVLQPGQPKPFPCTLPAVCGHISIVSVNCRRRPSIIRIKAVVQCAYIWIISKRVLLKYIHSTSELESPVLTIESWQKVWPSVFSVCSARQTACVWSHRRHRSALHAVELQSSWVWRHAIHRLALDHCCTCTTSSSTTFYTSYASIITASTINNNKKETTTTTRTTTTNIFLPFLKLFWLHHIHLWGKPPQKKSTLSFGHCPNWGDPPAQIDVDTFYLWSKNKNKEVAQIECRGEG